MLSLALSQAKSLHSYNPIPGGCVFYAPLWHPSLSGPVFKSIDPYGHVCTRTGGVLGPDGITMDGDDKIVVPNHASLNFGTGDFSLGLWVSIASTVGLQYLISKGSVGAGGKRYDIYLQANGYLAVDLDDDTNNTLVYPSLTDWDGYLNEWHLIGVSVDRDGNITTTFDGTVDGTPAANTTLLTIDDAAKNLCVGVQSSTGATNYLENGAKVGEVYVYKGRSLTEAEWQNIYLATKWRYA